MSSKPKLVIIGPGRVGRAVGLTAHRVGYTIAAIAGGTHPRRTEEFAAAVGDAPILPHAEAAARGDLVLLTVRDAAIAMVCKQLASAGGLDRRPVVAHCSGALGCDVLGPARAVGCPVGSLHPLQTFPSVEAAVGRLPGTYWFLTGEERAVEPLADLVRHLGGKAVPLADEDKPTYHAAAVFSSNYLTTVLDVAIELLTVTGLDRSEARQALTPIVRATVENVLEKGPAEALTGPISRGDVETIQKHLEALGRQDIVVGDLYRAIGRRTIELAVRSELLPRETADVLRQHLRGDA